MPTPATTGRAISVRLEGDDVRNVARITESLKAPFRRSPTTTDAVKAALAIAAGTLAASGVLPS